MYILYFILIIYINYFLIINYICNHYTFHHIFLMLYIFLKLFYFPDVDLVVVRPFFGQYFEFVLEILLLLYIYELS